LSSCGIEAFREWIERRSQEGPLHPFP
jgi:hypothetical protein